MDPAHGVGPGEVRDGARYPKHTMVAARAEPHRRGRVGQKASSRLVRRGDLVEKLAVGLGVGPDAMGRESLRLALAGGRDPRRHLRAPLRRRRKAQVGGAHRRDLDMEIDPVRHRATRNGQRIDLSAKEFALLSLLAQKTGQVLSRTQISSLVWDIHFDSDTNVVEVAVRRLRAKIDDPFEEKLIHTVRGVGYVLERRS